MQVEPIKFNLKPPGTERSKLKCDDPLSNFSLSLKLRCYNTVDIIRTTIDGYTSGQPPRSGDEQFPAVVIGGPAHVNVDSSVAGNSRGSSLLIFDGATGRGLHSSTFLLILGRFGYTCPCLPVS